MAKKLKYIPWTIESARGILQKRIHDSVQYRESTQEDPWRLNETTTYAPEGLLTKGRNYVADALGAQGTLESDLPPSEAQGFDSIGMNYTVRYYRLIQAQLSANPPSVTPTPLTSDSEDQRRAAAAEDIVKHALRQYQLQEEFDLVSAQVIMYGTGFMKVCWDELSGEPLDFDPETLEILKMEGDIHVKCCDTWDIYIDPIAKRWEEVRFVIQKNRYTASEIMAYWPEHYEEILTSPNGDIEDANSQTSFADRGREASEMQEQLYYIYEYWEKGLPENAFQGRYVEAMLRDGTCLTPPTHNPHRFGPKGKLPTAQLPFHIITDIDVTNQVYGNTFITYLTQLQDTLNRLDLQVLENIRAHGQVKMILPEGAEISDDMPSNDTWDIIQINGGGGSDPHFITPPNSMPDIASLRANIMQGLNDISGTNESMFGQQSRETSGFSMQYATNQGNLIRRRLFNKYVRLTEGVYNDILELVKKYWKEERLIQVEGQEGAFNAKQFKGADIEGGYDLVVQYGTTFSLDPMTRRQEILQLIPLFKEAGRPMDELLQHLKLNDLDSMNDTGFKSALRMREVLDVIIATKKPIEPRVMANHQARIKFAYDYLETAEFDRLDTETQMLIEDYIIKMEELEANKGGGAVAQGGAQAGGAVPQLPEGGPAEGAPPMDAAVSPMNPAPVA